MNRNAPLKCLALFASIFVFIEMMTAETKADMPDLPDVFDVEKASTLDPVFIRYDEKTMQLQDGQWGRYSVTINDGGGWVFHSAKREIVKNNAEDFGILWRNIMFFNGGRNWTIHALNTHYGWSRAKIHVHCKWRRTEASGGVQGAGGQGLLVGRATGIAKASLRFELVKTTLQWDYIHVDQVSAVGIRSVLLDKDDVEHPVTSWWTSKPDPGMTPIGTVAYNQTLQSDVQVNGEVAGYANVHARLMGEYAPPTADMIVEEEKSVIVYTIDVREIHFNHDTSSMTDDGVTIKKNHTTLITVPEWRRTPSKNEPACYIKDTTADVKVKLGVVPSGVTSVGIAASPVTGGDTGLPSLGQQTVSFTDGVSGLTDFSLTAPGTVKILEDSWEWEVSAVNGTTVDSCTVDTTDDHKVYLILSTPQDTMDKPWVQVLEHACDDAFAGGSTTINDAMNGIVHGVHYDFVERYPKIDYDPDPSVYSAGLITHTFDLTQFFSDIESPTVTEVNMQCADFSDIAIIFAAALGGEYNWRRKVDFDTKNIKNYREITHSTIGWGRWYGANPMLSHNFIQKRGSGTEGNVWDPTFRLDGDDDPMSKPCDEILAKNTTFETYRDTLVDHDVNDWGNPPLLQRSGQVSSVK